MWTNSAQRVFRYWTSLSFKSNKSNPTNPTNQAARLAIVMVLLLFSCCCCLVLPLSVCEHFNSNLPNRTASLPDRARSQVEPGETLTCILPVFYRALQAPILTLCNFRSALCAFIYCPILLFINKWFYTIASSDSSLITSTW